MVKVKKRIVFIMGILLPSPNPPGRIGKQFVDMIKEDCDVSIIFLQSYGEAFNGELLDGVKYYSITGLMFKLENYFFKKNIRLLVFACKAVGRIQRFLFVNGNLAWFYEKAFVKLNEISQSENIDVVFSICNPFQSHLAALKFKKTNPDLKFVTYTVDPFVKGSQFKGFKLKKALKMEKDVYENSNHNFVSEEIFDTERNKFESILHKTEVLPYALFNIQKTLTSGYFDKNKVNLVYAGNFYNKIRNPKFMLESILDLNDDRVVLHLYSGGECQDLVNYYVKKSKGKFIKHKMVSHFEIVDIMNSCDFLVSVSNNVKEFQPSKTFEYVAIGKPIINFYEGDNIDQVFSKYPLCIQLSNKKNQLDELKFFIDNSFNKKLSFDEIEKIYYQNSCDNIKHKLHVALFD